MAGVDRAGTGAALPAPAPGADRTAAGDSRSSEDGSPLPAALWSRAAEAALRAAFPADDVRVEHAAPHLLTVRVHPFAATAPPVRITWAADAPTGTLTG